jgi:Tfp pilus assembly protein PilF
MPSPKVQKNASGIPSELAAGLAAQRLGRLAEAEVLYRAVLKNHPKHWQALHQLGSVHLARGELAEALECIGAAMKSNSSSAEITSNYGVVLRRLKRDSEAIEYFNRALILKPGYAPALLTRGAALQRLGRRTEALANFDRLIQANPAHAKAHYNRACILHELQRFDEALAAYTRALQLAPDDADIHWNESLTRLLLGDFPRGWEKYEWRKKRPGYEDRKFAPPQWGGEPIAGKTILVHAEQGFGDTLQFARYVPMLASMGAKVVLEVQPPLKSLMATLPGVSTLIARGEPLPAFDIHCPIMSLPLALGTTFKTIPAVVPYLKAPEYRVQDWQARLPRNGKLRVAFAWSGSATHEHDAVRSIPLEKWRPLLDHRDIQWISIQRDLRTGDEAILAAYPSIVHVGAELKDFAETAAVIAACDLVVSVDTSVAHLAGALDRRAWILLQHSPDFRWLLNRSDSPWYPRTRLFRQPSFGDWESVLKAVSKEMESLREALHFPAS